MGDIAKHVHYIDMNIQCTCKPTHNIPEKRIEYNTESCQPKICIYPINWQLHLDNWFDHLRQEHRKFFYYRRTPIKRPPIKRPVIKVPELLSVLYLNKTLIKRPPFGYPNESSPIVFTPIKRPPRI